MRFTIIIPFLNSEKTLRKCLQSVVDQYFDDIEVILIDNGSTDKSTSVINEFKSLNIKYFIDKRGGIGKLRNIGIKNSTGDYILFLDSDDYFNRGLINCLQNRIHTDLQEVDIIRFNANRIEYLSATNKEINKYKLCEMLPQTPKTALNIFQQNQCEFGPLWLYCYKTEFIKQNKFRFLNHYIHEDLLNDYMLCKANKIANIDFVGYNYVKNPNGVTAPKDPRNEKLRAKAIIKNYDYVSRLMIKYLKHDFEFLKLRMEIFKEMLIYNAKYFTGQTRMYYFNMIRKRERRYKNLIYMLKKCNV